MPCQECSERAPKRLPYPPPHPTSPLPRQGRQLCKASSAAHASVVHAVGGALPSSKTEHRAATQNKGRALVTTQLTVTLPALHQGAAKGVRQKEFDHFFSFSGRFRSLFLMLLSLFSSLFCQTPFAGLLLRQGDSREMFVNIFSYLRGKFALKKGGHFGFFFRFLGSQKSTAEKSTVQKLPKIGSLIGNQSQ